MTPSQKVALACVALALVVFLVLLRFGGLLFAAVAALIVLGIAFNAWTRTGGNARNMDR